MKTEPQWIQAPDGSWHQAITPAIAPPPPPAPKKNSELGKGILALLMCMLGAGAVLAIGAGASSTKTAATTAPAAAPAATETLAQWGLRTKYHADDVAAATGDVASAAKSYDTPAMITACQQLRADVVSWRAELPSPDPAFDALLSPALDAYVRSADRCISGGQTLNAADLKAASDAIEEGTIGIKAATAYLAAHAS